MGGRRAAARATMRATGGTGTADAITVDREECFADAAAFMAAARASEAFK